MKILYTKGLRMQIGVNHVFTVASVSPIPKGVWQLWWDFGLGMRKWIWAQLVGLLNMDFYVAEMPSHASSCFAYVYFG